MLRPIDTAPITARLNGVDPGAREVPFTGFSEGDHAARGRNLALLVVREQPHGLPIAPRPLAEGGERLESGSEVEGFRVDPGIGCASKPSPRAKRRSRRGAAWLVRMRSRALAGLLGIVTRPVSARGMMVRGNRQPSANPLDGVAQSTPRRTSRWRSSSTT